MFVSTELMFEIRIRSRYMVRLPLERACVAVIQEAGMWVSSVGLACLARPPPSPLNVSRPPRRLATMGGVLAVGNSNDNV